MQGKLHRTLSTLLAAVLFFGISATAYASTGNGNLLQLIKAQSLVAEETEFTLYPKDTAILDYKLMPENSEPEGFDITVENKAVVSQSDREITAVGTGQSKITVTCDSGFSVEYKVNVIPRPHLELNSTATAKCFAPEKRKAVEFETVSNETGNYSFEVETEYPIECFVRSVNGNSTRHFGKTAPINGKVCKNIELTAACSYVIGIIPENAPQDYTVTVELTTVDDSPLVPETPVESMTFSLCEQAELGNGFLPNIYGGKIKIKYKDGRTVETEITKETLLFDEYASPYMLIDDERLDFGQLGDIEYTQIGVLFLNSEASAKVFITEKRTPQSITVESFSSQNEDFVLTLTYDDGTDRVLPLKNAVCKYVPDMDIYACVGITDFGMINYSVLKNGLSDTFTVDILERSVENVKAQPIREITVKENSNVLDSTVGIKAINSCTAAEITAATGGKTKLFNSDGTEAKESDTLKTGMKIKLIVNGTVVDETEVIVLGDVNCDGNVSVTDARLALRQAVGLEEMSGARLAAAQLTDGKSAVSVGDARLILRAAVTLDDPKSWLLNIK